MPIGVDVEDFVARVEFINPSDATDRPWDFGIAFREQENGDHYRVTVASDGSWEYQIGLQADLAGGTVPSLSFEEGGRNVLEVVVAGDSAGFSVNGVFVSELNASELTVRPTSGSGPDSIRRMRLMAKSRGLKTSRSGPSRRLRSRPRPRRR